MDIQDDIVTTLVPLLLALIGAFLIVEWFIDERKEKIATYLTLAERDLNNLLSSGLEHGGRKSKAVERSEWASAYPIIQLSGFGHRTAAEDLIAENEKELKSKGATMGKATITAFLLRELYEGNVGAAQSKIFADTLNNEGTPPYIAPGIYELVGFDKFDAKTGFAPDAGVSSRLLRRVVREMRFPRDIQIVKTDAKGMRFRLTGKEVLTELTEQKV